MRATILVLILCSVLALAACAPVLTGGPQQLVGSGKLVTQEFPLEGFSKIKAASNFQVTVHPGNQFAVSVTADDNLIEHLTAGVSNNELRLDMKPGSNFGLTNVTMKADVSLPALDAVETQGNAVVHMGDVSGDNLSLTGQSNGIIDGNVAVGRLVIDAGSNGQIKLSGSADDMQIKGEGNAILRLENLKAQIARVDLGSNALATVNVTEKLDYSVGGNGGLTYSGGATLGEQKTAGNGKARAR